MAEHPPNIGQEPQGYTRDAIHVAVIAAVAHKTLSAGAHVGLTKYDSEYYETTDDAHIGIVDPFIRKEIHVGSMCWVMLYPNTVRSLRHHWVHPKLEDVSVEEVKLIKYEKPAPDPMVKKAQTYLQNMANQLDITYEQVIQIGHTYKETEEYFVMYGSDAHPSDYPYYWEHWEVVTGEKRPSDTEWLPDSPVSCSC